MSDMLMDWLIVGILVIAVFQLTRVTAQLNEIEDTASRLLLLFEKAKQMSSGN